MNWRNRWTFWTVVATVLALVSIPSVEWVDALREYTQFVAGWQPTPLRPTRTTYTPREHRDVDEPELKSVEFKHRAPRAKSVELIGDFNAWTPGLLKMKRAGELWTIGVPLRAGRHKYLFLDDGRPTLDPSAEKAPGPEGRTVSVKTVKE